MKPIFKNTGAKKEINCINKTKKGMNIMTRCKLGPTVTSPYSAAGVPSKPQHRCHSLTDTHKGLFLHYDVLLESMLWWGKRLSSLYCMVA